MGSSLSQRLCQLAIDSTKKEFPSKFSHRAAAAVTPTSASETQSQDYYQLF